MYYLDSGVSSAYAYICQKRVRERGAGSSLLNACSTAPANRGRDTVTGSGVGRRAPERMLLSPREPGNVHGRLDHQPQRYLPPARSYACTCTQAHRQGAAGCGMWTVGQWQLHQLRVRASARVWVNVGFRSGRGVIYHSLYLIRA